MKPPTHKHRAEASLKKKVVKCWAIMNHCNSTKLAHQWVQTPQGVIHWENALRIYTKKEDAENDLLRNNNPRGLISIVPCTIHYSLPNKTK